MLEDFAENLEFPDHLKNWGQNTKVRDSAFNDHSGPMAVFHGSHHDKPYFGRGTHFGYAWAAEHRLGDLSYRMGGFEKAKIYKAYLNIENPYRVRDSWYGAPIGAGKDNLFNEMPIFSPREKYHILEPNLQYHSREYKIHNQAILMECAHHGFQPSTDREQLYAREHLITFRFFDALEKRDLMV